MAAKGVRTETAPPPWSDFETLMSRITYAAQVNGEPGLYRFLVFAAVSSYCGLRAGDVLRLRWRDVLNKSSFTVREAKTGKVRDLTVNPKLESIINLAYELAGHGSVDCYVVSNQRSKGEKPLTIQFINRWTKVIFERFGVAAQSASTHTFRKTFGRRVFEMNGKTDDSLIILSDIFNHASAAVTRRYIGLRREAIRDVYLTL